MSESILIVDDEQMVCHTVCEILESFGYRTAAAESAEQALEAVNRTPVDLVITDLKMPGMDGLSLGEKLLEQDPNRPVLLLTAYADLDSARRAIAIGIYDYIVKPFQTIDLTASIGRALNYRRLILEKQDYQRTLEQKVEERTQELSEAYARLSESHQQNLSLTQRLERKVKELEGRNRLLEYFSTIHPLEETLRTVLQVISDTLGFNRCAIYLSDSGMSHLEVKAALGLFQIGEFLSKDQLEAQNTSSSQDEKQIVNVAFKQGQPLAGSDGRSAAIPLLKDERCLGVIEVICPQERASIVQEDLESLMAFGYQAAIAIRDSQTVQNFPAWREDLDAALKAIATQETDDDIFRED